MNKVKVLIVDDSAFMRNALKKMLESDKDIHVISTARDGQEGLEKIKLYKPDIVTLDIEMPRMDGLTALKKIMSENPLPVIMISSLTQEGAQATMEALSLGAVDFIPKELSFSSLSIMDIKSDLIEKIKHIAGKKMFSRNSIHLSRLTSQRRTTRVTPVRSQLTTSKKISDRVPEQELPKNITISRKNNIEVITLGISTGGPKALQVMLPMIPSDLPVGLLIVQHMPKSFTGPFADRLNKLCQINVKEAEHGEEIIKGTAYIAQGGSHMKIETRGSKKFIQIADEPMNSLHKPSVDVMMLSVTKSVRGKIMGVIMTGMGSDGTYGMVDIKQKNGVTIAESEDSCIVYGMPKSVISKGVVDIIKPLEDIASAIVQNL